MLPNSIGVTPFWPALPAGHGKASPVARLIWFVTRLPAGLGTPFLVIGRTPVKVGLPAVTAFGPMVLSISPIGLPGKAACSCATPVGVGTRLGAEELGEPAKRWRSMLLEPKNQILSFLIGPPTLPPKRLSTKPGTVGSVQPVEVDTPGGQIPNNGLFSWFSSESNIEPCQNSYPVPWN